MESYGQYCPVSRAAEILGDRWSLLILRDMVVDGVTQFNDLSRGLPRLSRSLLARRLRKLEDSGVITHARRPAGQKGEYRLTPAGAALYPVIEALLGWGATWAFGDPQMDELDPVVLMWWIHRRLRHDHLPPAQVVVEFHFEEDPARAYWLVLRGRDSSVCFTPPGFDTDVVVRTSLRDFYRVWLGRLTYDDASRQGLIRVQALPALERALPDWFAWSSAADAVRHVHAARRGTPGASPPAP